MRDQNDESDRLGKGLSALIPDEPPPADRTGLVEIDVDRLAPSDYQPRTTMDTARLDELAASIRANGVIQPIVVRKTADGYRIIAGERRWRAAQKAGLTRVPVVVKEVTGPDAQGRLLQMALIENIQREDLNAIEEAKAYRRLVDEFSLTQDAIAAAVGKDRATIANTLRLLKLPDELQNDLSAGALTMGHARAILALPSEALQVRVAREVKTRGLSVRETEALVKAALEGREIGGPTPRTTRPVTPPDVHTRAAEERLKIQLGTRVRIVRKGKGGGSRRFHDEDELSLFERASDGVRCRVFAEEHLASRLGTSTATGRIESCYTPHELVACEAARASLPPASWRACCTTCRRRPIRTCSSTSADPMTRESTGGQAARRSCRRWISSRRSSTTRLRTGRSRRPTR